MYGHRDVIAKSEVVQSVDGKEDEDIWEPANEGYGAWFEEERWVGEREMGRVGEGSGEEELDKSYQQAWRTLVATGGYFKTLVLSYRFEVLP